MSIIGRPSDDYGLVTFRKNDATTTVLEIGGNIASGFFINNYYAASTSFATNAITRMTISSSGYVGIGTTTPSQLVDIQASGASAFVQIGGGASSQAGLLFQRGATSKFQWVLNSDDSLNAYNYTTSGISFKITSAGNVLIGSTSFDYRLVSVNNTNTRAGYFRNEFGTGYTNSVLITEATVAAGTGFNLLHCYAGAAQQFYVRGDGVIFAQNTTVQAISDIRTKENIINSNQGLDVINALRPVRFDFKEGFANNKKNQLGFIAQEVETVFPDAVDIWGESDEKNNPYKSVGTGALIPVLVKAIQEQNTLITSLQSRIVALENK